MTLIESLDSEAELLPEYYIPTLNGDILAFSNTSLWNTTAKVWDFQKLNNFHQNVIQGKSERIVFEIDLKTGKVLSEHLQDKDMVEFHDEL